MNENAHRYVTKAGDGVSSQTFLEEAVAGLTKSQKQISSKFFYDEQGSQLFEQICTLPEYYLTRTELVIMKEHVDEIISLLGKQLFLIEYGSGSSTKTRLLLDRLEEPAAYVPIDLSKSTLEEAARQLRQTYPNLEIIPLCADFTESYTLPTPRKAVERKVVYFPGSTIGNRTPPQAHQLFVSIVRHCGENGGLLIGADLQKEVAVLEAAYNDPQGVTRDFNLNLLVRMNRELGTDFDLKSFQHRAIYNPDEGRIEAYLISRRKQTISLDGSKISFEKGESIRTEISYKYTLEGFRKMVEDSGLKFQAVWTDPQKLFSVQYFIVPSSE